MSGYFNPWGSFETTAFDGNRGQMFHDFSIADIYLILAAVVVSGEASRQDLPDSVGQAQPDHEDSGSQGDEAATVR
jgi:hypothetical protein